MSVRRISDLAIVGFIALALVAARAAAAEWPCYMADAARSSVTGEKLEFPLTKIWVYQPPQAPSPAWPEPGKELHRMDFDYAFQPVAAGGMVYFGSSADDTVRALDAATGGLRWQFTTGGPVRFSPTIAEGRAYVASDDGGLYCLDAARGKLLWQFRAAPADDQLLGNGRMISRWPCRTGVLVADGVAYVTAGMWPSEGIYVYALDARTGKQIWCNDSSGDMYIDLPHGGASAFSGVAPQGYLLASTDTLLVPTGRSVPAAFDRHTGRLLYYRPASTQFNGGAWATIRGELFFNESHTRGPNADAHVGEAEPQPGDGMGAYKLASGTIIAELPDKHRVLSSGNVIYAAGGGSVQAIDLGAWLDKRSPDGCVLWTAEHARAYCLALADKALLVGGRGIVTAFDAASGKELWHSAVDGQVRGLAVADGRLLAATHRGTIACFEHRNVNVAARRVEEARAPIADASGRYAELAADIVRDTGVSKGYALIVGQSDSRLAVALASQSALHVINLLNDVGALAAERERLVRAGLYGSRVVAQGLLDMSRLPYAPYFADLVVVSGGKAGPSGRELYRILRPCGGVTYFLGGARAAATRIIKEAQIPPSEVRPSGSAPMVVRGRLPGAGEWRYHWADAGHAGVSDESRLRLPLKLLWFGGPGPDRMLDRHRGASAPVSVSGRVFVEGQNHVIAFDAYNGRELWCREMKGAARTRARSSAANLVADDDSIYLAISTSCHRLDQVTGKTVAVYSVPEPLTKEPASPFVDVRWPREWLVIGPFPEEAPPLPEEILRTAPQQIRFQGKQFVATALPVVKQALDLTYLYGGYGFRPLRPGERPRAYPRGDYTRDPAMRGKTAYAFAKIKCPKAGRLQIGAGANWWMQWFLDGKPIYSTLKKGNLGRPPAITDHVFSTDVSAGEHVLAVMVRAGSSGWSLISAGGKRYSDDLNFVPYDSRAPDWGYLSVSDDLVLGTCRGAALFALEKEGGSVRWLYRARQTIDNVSVAIGDGRVFLVDAMPRDKIDRARRRGVEIRSPRSLVALDLSTGSELWRQDDVPQTWYSLQYARGVVTVNANAGYDAATGRKIWQHRVEPERLPVIYDNWIIAQPYAYDLNTGVPRMASDLLSGERRPWKFPRAYGCGSVVGCKNLLLFRSGTAGFFDFSKDGTTTFGGIRPGCSVNMIPANGLMVMPEASSGCTCGYNFQTSMAMVPMEAGNEPWYVFHGDRPTAPVRQFRFNFGAPGDRSDLDGNRWLAFPRPIMTGACPSPVNVNMNPLAWFYHPSGEHNVQGTDRAWLYTSGLRGQGQIVAEFVMDPRVAAPQCERPPTIDGVLDDPCWRGARPVRFRHDAHLRTPKAALFVRRDAENLYFAFRREAVIRNGKPIPFVANQLGDYAQCWLDDDLEIYLSDSKLERCLQFGVSCSGGRIGCLQTVGRGRWKDPPKWRYESWIHPEWRPNWTCAVRKGARQWTAEVAIPLQTVRAAGIELSTLCLDVMSWNHSGYGNSLIYLRHFSITKGTIYRLPPLPQIIDRPIEVPARSFTVRLYFAEPDDVKAGERVFDLKLQGKPMLRDFDIIREAGRKNRALVKEFSGVVASSELTLELVPKAKQLTERTEPIINAIEVVEERAK